MNVVYKLSEPEIVLQPNVYAMLNYISENIKTNLIWVCLVRKMGAKYIVEDLYFPPQNVNEWAMCNFAEDYVSRITYSTFRYDYRDCKFNMLGRFTMGKTNVITDAVVKDFDKLANPLLDEYLMMQLDNRCNMEFAISRKATLLTELDYSINMEELIDKGAFKAILDSKIGHYTPYFAKKEDTTTALTVERKEVGASKANKVVVPKSVLLAENISWKEVV